MYNVSSRTGSVYFLLFQAHCFFFVFLRKTNKYTDFIKLEFFFEDWRFVLNFVIILLYVVTMNKILKSCLLVFNSLSKYKSNKKTKHKRGRKEIFLT